MDRFEACQRAWDRLTPEDVYGYPDDSREEAIAEAEQECSRLYAAALAAFPGDWDCVVDDADALAFGGTDALISETLANWPDLLPLPSVASLRAYARAVVAYAEARSNLDELEH